MDSGRIIQPSQDDRREAARLLRGRNLRATSGRVALMSALLGEEEPVAQKDLLGKLVARGFNRVSVYRALHAFLRAGIVHRVVTEDRVWRFAVSPEGGTGGEHAHFQCRACGRIQCLTGVPVPEVSLRRHRVEDAALTLRGLCPRCLEREGGAVRETARARRQQAGESGETSRDSEIHGARNPEPGSRLE